MNVEQFLQFANRLPEPLFLVSAEGVCLAANRGAGRRLQIPIGELRQMPLTEFLADAAPAVARYLNACARTSDPVPGALTLKTRQGDLLPCRAEGSVLVPRSEESASLLLLRLLPRVETPSQFDFLNQRIEELQREIAARKRTEISLREQREWFAVTLSSIGDAVIATDTAGRILFMNPIAEKLTGWLQEEAEGRPLEEVFCIINEQSRQFVDSPVAKVLREGQIVGLANHTALISRNGIEYAVADSASPIRDETGRILGVVMSFQDVTEARRSEDALRLHQKEIEALNQRLKKTMEETHHRIKNNLQILVALIEMQVLQQTESVPISELRRIGQHMRSLALIHDLLTDEAKTQENADYLDTDDALAQLLPVLQELAGNRTIRSRIAPFRLPIRHGTALAVLVNELVNNAMQHGKGDIELTLSCSGDLAQLEVGDRGPGFPQGFDVRRAARTGLELVERVSRWDMRGETYYANREDGGAGVVVRFPLDKEALSMGSSEPLSAPNAEKET